ncbi:Putative phosphinothricin acetyltransferase YwnH [Luteitalea pratensis]|uniref:Phosphinothricin acetyltransferase YwnH n=1 Tax=Luteitalea pratensis TaxID=1855912 RepID=A0A143PIK9_LUTPR|nr:GNAT family N-acetyltransferase [Luteitalea pratensis]AMY08093.1 Putative phosphinothricin acetyltransferase YwnH [Luteitalea pratensis]
MLIRPATDADVSALNALVTAVSRERAYLGSTEGFTLEQTQGYIAHLRQSNGIALVAIDGDRLLGWIDIARGPFEGLTHYGRLGMGVAPDSRGQGLGRLLLERALDEGFGMGLDRIELEVFASNVRAVELYRRTGFVEEGNRRSARKLDGVYDDILMFGLLRHEWRTAG